MVGLIVFSDANSIRMNLKTLKINLYIASMQKKNRLFKKNSFICFLLKKTLFFFAKKTSSKKNGFLPITTREYVLLVSMTSCQCDHGVRGGGCWVCCSHHHEQCQIWNSFLHFLQNILIDLICQNPVFMIFMSNIPQRRILAVDCNQQRDIGSAGPYRLNGRHYGGN